MSSPHPHHPHRAAILAVPVVAALVLTLFAWPSARLETRDLPIGVAAGSAEHRRSFFPTKGAT